MDWAFRTLLAMILAASFHVTVGAQFQEGPPTKAVVAKAERTPAKTVKVEVPPITQVERNDTPVFRGENSFIQRCSICHADQWDRKRSDPPRVSLAGVLKDASPDREAAVREQIRRGSLSMPSFQHTFTPSEVDDLVTYLKTL